MATSDRWELGTYEFENKTWFLSYCEGFVRASPVTFKAHHEPENELIGDVYGAFLYVNSSPVPPLAEAARRFRKHDTW